MQIAGLSISAAKTEAQNIKLPAKNHANKQDDIYNTQSTCISSYFTHGKAR